MEEDETYDYDKENSSSIPGEVVTSGVVIIKKNYISLVRPMDVLESLALNSGVNTRELQRGVLGTKKKKKN